MPIFVLTYCDNFTQVCTIKAVKRYVDDISKQKLAELFYEL